MGFHLISRRSSFLITRHLLLVTGPWSFVTQNVNHYLYNNKYILSFWWNVIHRIEEESYQLHPWYFPLLPETLYYCTESQLFLLSLPLLPKHTWIRFFATLQNDNHLEFYICSELSDQSCFFHLLYTAYKLLSPVSQPTPQKPGTFYLCYGFLPALPLRQTGGLLSMPEIRWPLKSNKML